VHLLAAVEHGRGVVVAQVDVDAKTNEVALFSDLLDQAEDLTDVLVTVDALHAQTSHAEFLHARGAHLLVTVKGNQPTLHATLKALPWKDVPVGHVNTSHGHGRIENRTVKAVTVAAGLGFPHAAQAIKITRVSTPINRKGGRRREVVYAICTLPAEQAQPADLATWIRGHWHIENKLHWVRDVTFGEDLHQARTGSGPEVMAILRNLAISLHRLAGATNIARALRRHGRHPNEAIMTLTRDYRTTQGPCPPPGPRRAVSVHQRPGQGVHRGRAAGDQRGHEEEGSARRAARRPGRSGTGRGSRYGCAPTTSPRRVPTRQCPTASTTWPPTPGGVGGLRWGHRCVRGRDPAPLVER
jgi:predicted transposase YbfD/YdcC